jgi:hypothetical protein
MDLKPPGGETGDVLKRARLLESSRRTRDDDQLLGRLHFRQGRSIQRDDLRFEAAGE